MEKNMGAFDRIARFIIALFAIYLGIYYNIAFFIIALFVLFEVITSWCIFYHFLNINNCKEDKEKDRKKRK